MTFRGDVELVEGQSPSKTTTVVLRKRMGFKEQAGEKDIEVFLNGFR